MRDKIEEINFLNKEMIPEHFEGSRSIVDVRCKSETGKEFIIEMQNADNSIFIERSQVYGSKSMVDQFDSIRSEFRTLEQEKKEQAAKENKDYKKPNWDGGYKSLAPTIVLMITSYNIFPNAPYLTNHKMICEETQEVHFKLLGYCVVNLVKYKQDKEILKNKINKAEQDWLDLLLDASFMENAPRDVIPEVQHAYEVLERSTWSLEDLETLSQS